VASHAAGRDERPPPLPSGEVPSSHADLTIGVVATATNVNVAVLRAWEARFGFPTPHRTPSGHRRYSAQQVEQIRQVQRDRDAGMSLDAAIRRAMVDDGRGETSIFAGLRQRWPELPVHLLSKRALLAISRAIEDECCARAQRPMLVGSFQRERFYRRSEDRWRELARTASTVVVFADFPKTRRRRRGIVEIAVAADAPVLREWAVICDAPNFTACLVALERPGRTAAGQRRFEALWSVDPALVSDALAISTTLAGNDDETRLMLSRSRSASDPVANMTSATSLVSRIVAYLDT
jgi:MerR family transcriptional regulator, light-induced transcriptional regulator